MTKSAESLNDITETPKVDGMVIYCDGSFRDNRAGWGLHGYGYTKTPLKQGIGNKQLPTVNGYQKVDMNQSVSPCYYIDGYGKVEGDSTNNTAELRAAIKAFEVAESYGINDLLIYTDSEYVRMGLERHINNWIKNGWRKSDGNPVANVELWKELQLCRSKFNEAGNKSKIKWVEAHDGNLGNELADLNARVGSSRNEPKGHVIESPALKYHNVDVESSPLIIRTRMLFNVEEKPDPEGHHVYYTYQLGRSQTYGYKKEDTVDTRHAKSDLLLGKRIPDATFCVSILKEPERLLDILKAAHTAKHHRGMDDLVVGRLDNAYLTEAYKRINLYGSDYVAPGGGGGSLVTPRDVLITRTLNPPRLAKDAVPVFQNMQRNLEELLSDTLGESITKIDITNYLYGESGEGKKRAVKLNADITSQTRELILSKEKVNDIGLKIKLILGVDIPPRNPLAKLAGYNPKVYLLIVPVGPQAFSFSTVFTTDIGCSIYSSPYTQFITPDKAG